MSLGCGSISVPAKAGWDPLGAAQAWGGSLSPFPAPRPSLPAGAEQGLLFPGHRADTPAFPRRHSHGPARPCHHHRHHRPHPEGPPGPQNRRHPNPELAAHGPHGSAG